MLTGCRRLSSSYEEDLEGPSEIIVVVAEIGMKVPILES